MRHRVLRSTGARRACPVYVSGEQVELVASDVIIAPVMDGESVPADHPLLAPLPAVRDGRLFEVSLWRWFSRSPLGAMKVLDDVEGILADLRTAAAGPAPAVD